MTLTIPWERLGKGHRPPGYTRTLVLCESCSAPLGVVDQPPPGAGPLAIQAWAEAMGRVVEPHRRQEPRAWGFREARVNLISESDLGAAGTLENLLGSRWAEVLKGIPHD